MTLTTGALTYGGTGVQSSGDILQLNKGSQTSLTLTAVSLARASYGTLVLQPAGGLATLGVSESLKLTTSAGNANGIYATAGIVAQDTSTPAIGTFVKDNGSGVLVTAESGTTGYTTVSSGSGGLTANSVSDITGAYTVNTASTPYALRVGATTLTTTTGQAVTLGSGVIIMNPSNSTQSIITGTGNPLTTGGTEFDVYVGGGSQTAQIVGGSLATAKKHRQVRPRHARPQDQLRRGGPVAGDQRRHGNRYGQRQQRMRPLAPSSSTTAARSSTARTIASATPPCSP